MNLAQYRNKPIVELLLRLIPDVLYIRLLYRKNVGHWPNLKTPHSFTEKLQWLKLHNRKPEYSIMVDKHLVKDYVSNIIGKEYIIPTLAVWNTVDEIDLKVLPNQFVLKWNHDSGSIVICRDKSSFDLEEAKRKLAGGQRKNGFWYGREWPYKNVKPVIIAEQFMQESNRPETDLADYKFYCFNGEPRYCQVIRDRSINESIDFYDMDWNLMPFVGLNPKCKNGRVPVDQPKHFEQMKTICRKLSDKSPFTRVDLYVIDDKEYFGEITLFPASGFGQFTPEEWDTHLGDLLNLQGTMGGGYKCLVINDVLTIENAADDLKDYKFFCFNGKVQYFKIDFERFCGHKANYYDRNGNLQYFGEKSCVPDYNRVLQIPTNLDEMEALAEKLAGVAPFVRADFYNINSHIYFGEITFFPASGFGPFTSVEWDNKLGNLLKL